MAELETNGGLSTPKPESEETPATEQMNEQHPSGLAILGAHAGSAQNSEGSTVGHREMSEKLDVATDHISPMPFALNGAEGVQNASQSATSRPSTGPESNQDTTASVAEQQVIPDDSIEAMCDEADGSKEPRSTSSVTTELDVATLNRNICSTDDSSALPTEDHVPPTPDESISSAPFPVSEEASSEVRPDDFEIPQATHVNESHYSCGDTEISTFPDDVSKTPDPGTHAVTSAVDDEHKNSGQAPGAEKSGTIAIDLPITMLKCTFTSEPGGSAGQVVRTSCVEPEHNALDFDTIEEQEEHKAFMDELAQTMQVPSLPKSELPDIAFSEEMTDCLESNFFVKEVVQETTETPVEEDDDEEIDITKVSLENWYGGELFPPMIINRVHCQDDIKDYYEFACSQLFTRVDEDEVVTTSEQLWPLSFCDQPAPGLENVSSIKLDLGESITGDGEDRMVTTSITADKLLDALNLPRTIVQKETAPSKPTATLAEHSVASISPNEERVKKLDEMMSSLDLSAFRLLDHDPATLRSLIRKESPDCDTNTLTILVEAHIISVCKTLVDSPQLARQYIAYCKSNPQYREAMTQPQLDVFCSSLQAIFYVTDEDITQNKLEAKHEIVHHPLIPTTILCQAKTICEDPICRKICMLLEQKLEINILERTFLDHQSVTFAFDEMSVGVLVTFPFKSSVDLAKWLVLEAHRYARVAIFCLVGETEKPDANTRSAMRQLSSTVALLTKPAPETKIYMARTEDALAHLIRFEIDSRCACGDSEWYRSRDRFKPVLDEIEEKEIQLLCGLPRISALNAESLLYEWSSPQAFLRAQEQTTSFIARLLNENLAPSPVYVQPIDEVSEPGSYEQYVSQDEIGHFSQGRGDANQGYNPAFWHGVGPHDWRRESHEPFVQVQQSTSSNYNQSDGAIWNQMVDGIPTTIRHNPGEQEPIQVAETPAPAKKLRRLGLSRSGNDKQTRLVWIYSNPPPRPQSLDQ